MESVATIHTASAKRYLGQFCKHFAHKLPVELADDNASGQVTFGAGICALAAESEALTITASAATAAEIATLQDVAARHLVRFAFREELILNWQTSG